MKISYFIGDMLFHLVYKYRWPDAMGKCVDKNKCIKSQKEEAGLR